MGDVSHKKARNAVRELYDGEWPGDPSSTLMKYINQQEARADLAAEQIERRELVELLSLARLAFAGNVSKDIVVNRIDAVLYELDKKEKGE